MTAAPTVQGRGRRAVRRNCSTAGVDVMLDDRGERPGAMFADWELIGVPHRVVISDRGLEGRAGRGARAGATPAATVALADGCAVVARCSGMAAALADGGLIAASRRAGGGRGAAGACRAALGAGAQVEEPLVDSVRTALSAAVAADGAAGAGLRRHRRAAGLPALARRSERAPEAPQDRARTRIEFLETLWYESQARRARDRRWCWA